MLYDIVLKYLIDVLNCNMLLIKITCQKNHLIDISYMILRPNDVWHL